MPPELPHQPSRECCAGRVAYDDELRRVDRLRSSPQPPVGRPHVFGSSWVRVLWGEPVLDAEGVGAGADLAEHPGDQALVGFGAAADEAAAVDEQDRGPGGGVATYRRLLDILLALALALALLSPYPLAASLRARFSRIYATAIICRRTRRGRRAAPTDVDRLRLGATRRAFGQRHQPLPCRGDRNRVGTGRPAAGVVPQVVRRNLELWHVRPPRPRRPMLGSPVPNEGGRRVPLAPLVRCGRAAASCSGGAAAGFMLLPPQQGHCRVRTWRHRPGLTQRHKVA